jgi:predicted ATPase
MAMVKLYGKSQPIPLRSLGDGLRRIFHFAIALQRTRAGDLLLLDEIENGVHYTALPALWTVIIKAARAKGVQVFATTHSWDCVLGFQQASAQESASAHLIKLYEEKGSIKASIFNEKELSLVAREEIEVR